MTLWACGLPALKRIVPLPVLVRFVASRRRSDRSCSNHAIPLTHLVHPTHQRREDVLAHLATLARWSCRLTRWSTGGNCLERGLVLYRFLSAAGFEPSLVAGFRKTEDGRLRGHAWVVVDGNPVGESAASLEDFERALAFGPDGLALDRKPAFI